MLPRLLPALFAIALALFSPAVGAGEVRQGAKAVLELFTSQGCSSCPAADALLDELSKRSDVVALAYHVDYWDYIGWADTFGTEANSDRQRDYARSWGSGRIFTPQLVVNGLGGVVASRKKDVAAALQTEQLKLPVSLHSTGDGMLEIAVPPGREAKSAVVWLVTFLDRAEVEVSRGENSGKRLVYSQIVTGRQVLGMWEPEKGAQFKLPLAEVLGEPSNGVAILVQQEQHSLPGPIIGAASLIR